MIRYRCDGCGANLPADGLGHFIVRVEAFAAAGRLEFSEEDLRRDHSAEIRRAIEQAERLTQDQLEESVYRAWRYDLCAACHRRYTANPLGRGEAESSPA